MNQWISLDAEIAAPIEKETVDQFRYSLVCGINNEQAELQHPE